MRDRHPALTMLVASASALVAMPIWFFTSIAILSSQSDEINNAGLQAYFGITVVLSLPTALTAGFVVGPFAVWLLGSRRWLPIVLSLSFLAFACSLWFFAGWFFSRLPGSCDWLLLPYTAFAFIGPPFFVGTTVYTASRRG